MSGGLVTKEGSLDEKEIVALHFIEQVTKEVFSYRRVKRILSKPGARRGGLVLRLRQALKEETNTNLSPERIEQYKEAMVLLKEHKSNPLVRTDYDRSWIVYQVLFEDENVH